MSHLLRLAVLLLPALGLVSPAPVAAAAAVPTPSAPEAEQSAFDGANRSLAEQSMSRACEAFRDFLRKHPSSELAREAQVKAAQACLSAGRDGSASMQTLRKVADEGAVDLPRALANAILVERGEAWTSKGKDRTALALEQLEAVARGSGGRWAKEARGLFFRRALRQMEQQLYDTKRVEGLCERVLSLEPSANDRAHALLLRARSWMQTGNKDRLARAEKELLELGRGQSEYADDALFMLAQQKEGASQYAPALELYGQIQSRFNGTTSNVFDQARSRAQEIRRPQLSISTQYIEQPGVKPTLYLSFRNLTEVTLVLRRAEPLQQAPEQAIDSAPMGAPGEVVKQWTRKLSEPAPHVPSSLEERLEVPGPGAWIVEASSGRERASDWLLITPLAMALKVSHEEVAVFVANAITGEAARNAEVVVFTRSYDDRTVHSRFQGRTDEAGLAQIPLKVPGRLQNLTAWASTGAHLTFARGWTRGYSSSEEQREWLAYVLPDRPLYKPGETVGAKLFLRSRANGPSTPVAGRAVRVRVYDAQSREVLTKELTTSAFGTAAFELPLGKDAALGQWRFHVESAGGASLYFQQSNSVFRVEEFKPPEFQVSVVPVGSPAPGQQVKVRISASRYSGGPVANANGRAIVTELGYVHQWSRWEDDIEVGWGGWGGYGDDEERYYRHRGWQPTYRQTTLTFKTGADGSAELELPKPQDAGDRSYQVQVFVTDASRREVTGSGTINVSSTPVFVDVRSNRYLYKPGEPIQLKLRAEDANGRAQSPAVEVRLIRLEKDGRQSTILTRAAQLKNGRGEAVLDGDAVGSTRIEVRRPGAPDTEPAYATTDVWLTSDVKPITPPDMGFALLTDRAPLAVGGTVRALVVTPTGGGHVLFTIEGQSLHAAKSFPLNGRARFVELPLTAAMTPNAWLHAGRFEQGNFLQQQAVVKVSGTDNALQVNVSHSSEVVEPGDPQKARIEVKGAKSEVELLVSSVDEAIFAIQPDRSDLLSYFGRRPQQHWVTTGYTQNQRAFRPVPRKDEARPSEPQADSDDRAPARQPEPSPPASAAAPRDLARSDNEEASERSKSKKEARSVEPMELAAEPASEDAAGPGGGGLAQPPVKVRKNFSSSAGWFPQVPLAGQRTEVALKVPDSLTRFRTLVVAMTPGEQMGLGKASFRTEKPLMVRLQAPRFFTERDEVTLSALVSNRLGRAASVQVSINAPGFEPMSATQRTVEVPAGADTRVDVRYRVVKPGEVKLQAVARGGGSQDAMELTLPVVVHGSAQRASFAGRLSDSVQLQVKLPEQRNADATRFELTVSPTLVSVMMDALPYLAQYPYGCVEQTLSRFVPAAIAAKTARDLGLPKSRVPENLDDMVDAGLKRLYGFQHGDGGWGWWQSDATNRWMTAYVVYGLSLGRSAGLQINTSVLERGRAYLTSHLGAALGNPEEHTWMLFALASTGGAPKAGLDKAFERRSRLSKRGRALLALALISAKDPRARIAVENLDDILKAAKDRQDASAGDADDVWQTSEAIEATAYTLMAISRHDPGSPWVKPLTDFLVLRRNGGKWRTTRDTAFSLYALSELAAREKASQSSGSFTVQVNGREAARIRFSAGGMDLSGPVVLTDAAFRPGENTVVLLRDGAPVTGYYAATFDVYNRDENVKGVGGDVKVSRTYTLLGRPSAASERISAPTEYGMPLESGVRVRVDLEVKANKAMEFLLIEDLKPAGLEAVAQQSGPEICEYRCAHVELRTDRVAFFLSQLPVGVTKLSYELRAEAPGRFHALPARVEAMYAPELRATSDEMRMEVRDAPEPGDGVAKDGR